MRPAALGAAALAILAAAPAQAHDNHAMWPATPSWTAAAGLPDIEQIPPYKIGIVQREGRWYIGFAAAARNVGAGGLRIRGSRRPDGTMAAQQLTDDGLQVLNPAVGTLRYVTTYGHAHWHYMRFMRYELAGLDVPGALVDRKQGFCLGDAPWVEGWCARGRPEISAIDEGIRAGRRRHLRAQRRRPGDRDRPPHGAWGPVRPHVAHRADGRARGDAHRQQRRVHRHRSCAGRSRTGRSLAPIGSCVGEGCAGAASPGAAVAADVRRGRAGARAPGAAAGDRAAALASADPLPDAAQAAQGLRRPARARRSARFAGTVRVWYRQEGAATRWYYSVDVVRRLTGCHGGGCRRDIRRPSRLGGTIRR